MECQSHYDEKSCYIWYDPDPKLYPRVIDAIKESGLCIAELPILHLSANADSSLTTASFLGFVLHICRKNKLLQNDFTSFLCSKDYQLAMQLCAARISKKEKGEFAMDMSSMMSYLSTYMTTYTEDSDHSDGGECHILKEYLDFLKLSNSIDEWQLIFLFKKMLCSDDYSLKAFLHGHTILINGIPANPISMRILELLTKTRKVFKIHVEVPLDASFHEGMNNANINVTMEQISLEHITIVKSVFSHISATEDYVKEISIAFLRLLVNCRDEMALARALISPIIEMSHAAFTDLKRLSIEKGMPMCQTAISYITQIRLGGKSYAPSKDCPLHQHMKGLSLFVDFLQHLQTVLEDELYPMSCFKRIVRMIKNRLLKRNYLRSESVENATEGIIQLITSFHCKYKENDWYNLDMDETETNKMSSLKTTKFLCWIVDCLSTQHAFADMYDIFCNTNGQRTPLNLPTIFSYFKSPLETDGVERPYNSNKCEKAAEAALKELQKSDLVSSKKIFDTKSSTEINKPPVPQTTTPVLKSRKKKQWNIENISDKEPVIKKTKRCIFGDLSNVPNKTVNKNKTSARSKKAKDLPKGQTNIIQYFLPR